MKKLVMFYLVIIFTLPLMSCKEASLIGEWKDPKGISEITFNERDVIFFDIEGTYVVKQKRLIMTLNKSELIFEFELVEDQLTLFLNDSKIVLDRQ